MPPGRPMHADKMNRVKTLLRKAARSVPELAAEVGMSKRTVWRWLHLIESDVAVELVRVGTGVPVRYRLKTR